MMKRHCSGDSRCSSDRIMALTPTDLPEPVVPATSRCGMRTRSVKTGVPLMLLPSTSGRMASVDRKASDSNISRRNTVSRRVLGSSMPMALRPGTTATRADSALMERAMSSASAITRDDLMPRAGSNSNCVTTGPGWISFTSPRTPKSASTSCSMVACWRVAWFSSDAGLDAGGRRKMLCGGRL